MCWHRYCCISAALFACKLTQVALTLSTSIFLNLGLCNLLPGFSENFPRFFLGGVWRKKEGGLMQRCGQHYPRRMRCQLQAAQAILCIVAGRSASTHFVTLIRPFFSCHVDICHTWRKGQ